MAAIMHGAGSDHRIEATDVQIFRKISAVDQSDALAPIAEAVRHEARNLAGLPFSGAIDDEDVHWIAPSSMSVREQDRQLGLVDHVVGDAAEDTLAQTRVTVTTHDQKIRAECHRFLHQL